MKKKTIVVALIAVLLFLLGFQCCNALRLERYKGVSMTVVAGSSHREGVTVEITNHTDDKIEVGNMSSVRLQKRTFGFWLPLWRDFTAAQKGESGPVCDAGDTCTQEILWRGGYGAQRAGNYRILQKVRTGASEGRGRSHLISAAFVIP